MKESRPVPRVMLSGDARSRGMQHGEALRADIRRMLDIYAPMFALSQRELTARTNHFRAEIKALQPSLAEEIAGIAVGAGVSEAQIIALNARSELLSGSTPAANECTAVWLKRHALLGQTWDWLHELEPLITVLDITHQDGHRLLTLTEPGIVGKIGLSAAGVGVCLNFMRAPGLMRGLPIHVLLRAMLDCRHPDELTQLLRDAGANRSGHILVGLAEGAGFGLEFTGTQCCRLAEDDGVLTHTNHFLTRDIDPGPGGSNSRRRLTQARERARAGTQDWQQLLAILNDCTDTDDPITVSWREMPGWNFGPMGTVCAIAMDLRASCMAVRRGPQPSTTGWQLFDLNPTQPRVALQR